MNSTAAGADASWMTTLLRLQLPLNGVVHDLQLRVPTADEIYPLIHRPEHQTIEDIMRSVVMAELATMIEEVDGEEITPAIARAIYADAEALGTFMTARNRIYESIADAGLVHVLCPHCQEWEATFDVLGFARALNTTPWPIFESRRMFLALPSLSLPLPLGTRPPGISTSPQIRFEFPSWRLGLPVEASGGALGLADERQEAVARTSWEVPFNTPPEGYEHWTYERPGFRAAVRMCVALRRLDPPEYNERLDDISPEIFVEMPAPDYFFLDNIYYLTHNVDVEAGSRVITRCGACGQEFAPVW